MGGRCAQGRLGRSTPAKQPTKETARAGRAPLLLFFKRAHLLFGFPEAVVRGLKRLLLDQRRLHKHVQCIGIGTYRMDDEKSRPLCP